ncbi:pyridoxal phosphate-dependent transferase [Lasiosphaeria ovina]|uniref:Pyridoxal phosphate-dependent transferase n=1 Tax=Lasiosphaeria ovina TaxID=92902 RepID=A0AAE0JZU4_9PEZI|nr:pyridoxal phosphate-dependent transferase [Lasiosphaeria ovina]
MSAADDETFDIDQVRANFPALAGEQVFFDNAGGSQALGAVAERIRDYLLNTNVQLGASYATGKASTDRYDAGYAAAAAYVGASKDEIVLSPSTTQLFRNVSYALSSFQPGDEVVISVLDHEANIAPWLDLAERQQLVVKWWHPSPSSSKSNPKLAAEDLGRLLSRKTRLVTCTHASNILGTIHDVAGFAQTVRASASPDALVAVDAVAYAPHRKIDVKALGVDFYSFSWYKVYGPHISQLYASARAQAQLRSLGHYFNAHATLEHKLGLAGSNYELVHGISAVVEYLPDSKWPSITAQEGKLQATLLAYLDTRPDVTVWGEPGSDPGARVPTVSFTVAGRSSRALVEAVERDSVFGFRWGSFYSVRLVEQVLGLDAGDGVVRVSMVHYNTVEEVQALIAAIDKVLSRGQ